MTSASHAEAFVAIEAVLGLAAEGRASSVGFHGARGSGRSWLLEQAEQRAREAGFVTLRAVGRADDREVAFGGLQMLLGRFGEAGESIDPADANVVRSVVALDRTALDPLVVKMATLRSISARAAKSPLLLLLDDVDLLDAASADVLAFVLARLDRDAVATIAASRFEGALPMQRWSRVAPLSASEVAEVVMARGVARLAAEVCAAAANGNPGMARALADGLTDDQRAGRVPVPALPRPAGVIAQQYTNDVRVHGDQVARALVVAAADHDGEVAPIRAALAALGEGNDGLDRAEEVGLIAIDAGRVTFTDPWLRPISYHLVAPASRRAAHRALATAYNQPHQATSRVWHLVGAANGPNDELADVLQLLAADVSARGAAPSAATLLERAATFAETGERAEEFRLKAIGTWLAAGDIEQAVRLVQEARPIGAEAAVAAAEVNELWSGVIDTRGLASDGEWAARMAARRALWHAALAGNHRQATRHDAISPPAADAVLRSVLHRHAGRLREARDAALAADANSRGSGPFIASMVGLTNADLDILQLRTIDARRWLDHVQPSGQVTSAWSTVLAARIELVDDPEASPATRAAAFGVVGDGELAAIRDLVRVGVATADVAPLDEAIGRADAASLPVELGEARLWRAEVHHATGHDATELARVAHATLQRCGVRCWDERVARLLQRVNAPATRVADAGLDGLSQAELRVAEAVAAGMTNREAAATLFISVKTVDFHLQQIYRKLSLRSRTELAVRMANYEPTSARS